MSHWGDATLLVELLDRQFAYLLELRGTIQLIRLKHLLRMLHDEPRIAGLLEDLRVEALTALRDYDDADRAVRSELRELWAVDGVKLTTSLEEVADRASGDAGPIEGFEGRLERVRGARFSESSDDAQATHTKDLLKSVLCWLSQAGKPNETRDGGAEDEPFEGFGMGLRVLLHRHLHASRTLDAANRSLGWPAYERLLECVQLVNPVPPPVSDVARWTSFAEDSKFAGVLRMADEAPLEPGYDEAIDSIYDSLKADAKLLHEELRHRVGVVRSRLGLVKRYAAGCEAFHADRLRSECLADSRNAERILTLDFARFLFDAGLAPLIDATVSGLRPDILHVGSGGLFYVEAKQYDGEHPRSQIRRAYLQVWSTWGRLRKLHSSSEAFLVIFRRDGPWVEVPEVVTHEGLRLYSVVADISTSAGCAEKKAMLRVAEEDVLPAGEDLP